MGDQSRARVAGVFFLAAFLLYGGGQALLPDNKVLGIALIVTNSLAVAAIGVLFRPIIAEKAPLSANIYFTARLLEGLFLAIGTFLWVLSVDTSKGVHWNAMFYHLGMVSLGLDGMVFCRWLLTVGGMYNVLAWLGLTGYFF